MNERSRIKPWQRLLAALLVFTLQASPALAGATAVVPIPISSVPVGVGLSSLVKPNFLVMIDDSGSMNWEFMPGEQYAFHGSVVGLYAGACNRIYFDPAQEYPLPPAPDDPSATMPEPADSLAGPFPVDGFGVVGGTMAMDQFQIKPSPGGNGEWVSSVLAPRDAFWFEWAGAGTPDANNCKNSVDVMQPGNNFGLTAYGWRLKLYKDADVETQRRFRRWFVYYRTRLNVMKSAAGRAFATASEGLRIGFLTVNPWSSGDRTRQVSSDKYLKIDDFGKIQRSAWLKKLYAMTADPTAGTPLLEALSRAGRHFAGYNDGINRGMDDDPVEASCQRNYTLLATDGYWNRDYYQHIGYDNSIGYGHKFESSMSSPNEIGQQDGNVATQPIDPASPLDLPIPTPFSDAMQVIMHRQLQRDTSLQNNGTDANACPSTVQDPDHPYYGQKIKLPDGADRTPYMRWKLQYSRARAVRGKPKGYEESLFPSPVWAPGMDIYYGSEYGGWFYFGFEPVALAAGEKSTVDLTDPELASIVAELQRTIAVGSKSVLYNDGREWKSKVYDRSIKSEFAKIWRDSDGALNVCALLDYKCPGLTDGSTKVCDDGAADNPGAFSATLAAKLGKSFDPPTISEETLGALSLADVAMYYYANDLRTPSRNPTNRQNDKLVVHGNTLPGADPVNWQKLESDAAPHQHMTTYTLGLGVSGYLTYDPDYQSQSAADKDNPDKDYARIKYGMQGWIPPWLGDGRERIDDLWHAAVNGRGTYLSAQDPDQLFASLSKVIRAISAVTSGGAGATTSSIRPSASDRSAFATTYSAGEWTGDVKRGTVNLANGQITWDSISAADLLQSKVKADCDGRTIYLQRGSKRVDFSWDTRRCTSSGVADATTSSSALTTAAGAIDAADVSFFAQNLQSKLFASATPPGKNALGDGDLVNFLRGQYGKEYRTNVSARNRWFRERSRALGDLVGSQPIHVGTPIYNYTDRGYLDEEGAGGATVPGFKTRMKTGRAPMLYVGGNDGMLHAFDPATLEEKWALIPSLVVPDLVKLANPAYNMQHRFFLDGSPSVGDVYDPSAGGAAYADRWRTVLVGGLRAGGQGYYALDVTNSQDPKPLWEFSCATAGAKSDGKCDLGLSFGEPIITKRMEDATDRWVVLVSSGYNSESGKAVLFVLDALSGEVLERIAAADSGGTVGAPDDQAGFAAIAAWADDGMRKNRVEYVYGGDIRGRVWRFKITKGETGSQLLARLKDVNGAAQAVTAAPELAFDDDTGRRMVFVPTGRLLHPTDGASSVKDSIWGLVDHSSDTPTTRTGGDVSVCTVTVTGGDRTTNCTGKDAKSRGWVLDLPVDGERINVNPIVQLGTVIFASNAPTSTDICVAKGETFLYYLDISSGGALATSAGGRIGHAVAGVLAVGLKGFGTSGGYKVTIAGSGGEQITESPPTKQGTVGGKRVSWREIVR